MSWLFKDISPSPGVSNFLAPPPSSTAVDAVKSSNSYLNSPLSSQALIGVRNDLAEIGGSLRSGLSMLSINSSKAVGGISRFASNFLSFQSYSSEEEDEEDHEEAEESEDEIVEDAPGITEEVLHFVSEISLQSEYWMEFHLALDDFDFKMSDIQRAHAATMEQLVPSVSALKLKLQNFMNEQSFWMLYFILLLSRLNQHDYELLSTPEIIEARGTLLKKLQSGENSQVNSEHNHANNSVCGTQEGNTPSLEERNPTWVIRDGEGWEIPDEENTDHSREKAATKTSKDVVVRFAVEDMSFSDIEYDENDLYRKIKRAKRSRGSSPNESGEWVRLHENSEGEESSDWFSVKSFD